MASLSSVAIYYASLLRLALRSPSPLPFVALFLTIAIVNFIVRKYNSLTIIAVYHTFYIIKFRQDCQVVTIQNSLLSLIRL